MSSRPVFAVLCVAITSVGCFRDLDFAPCQQNPNDPICLADAADSTVADSDLAESPGEESTGPNIALDSDDVLSADTLDDSAEDDTGFDDGIADSSSDSGFDTTVPPDAGDSGHADADASDVMADVASDTAFCVSGSYRCSGAGGNQLEKCAADGKSYGAVAACPSAATCSASLGRCTACTPNGYSCSGSTRLKCDAFGATNSTVSTCATPELCAASAGATCAAPTCATGEKTCSGKTARTCNTGRTGWVDTSCTIGCAAGECVTVTDLAGFGEAQHFCARLSDGTARCWGANNFGQVDPSVATTTDIPKPTSLPSVTAVAQVAVGDGFTVVRLTDGTLKWWGSPPSASTAPISVPPSVVPGIASAVDVSAGIHTLCVLQAGGVLRCTGLGELNGLGDGSTADRFAPAFSNV